VPPLAFDPPGTFPVRRVTRHHPLRVIDHISSW
jgi:hypothetical protein